MSCFSSVNKKPIPMDDIVGVLKEYYADDPRSAWIDHFIESSRFHLKRFDGILSLLKKEKGDLLDIGFNAVLVAMYQQLEQFRISLSNFDNVQRSESWNINGQNLFCHYWNIETMEAPYDNDSFDCILFLEILEHLSVDPMKALSELNRITRNGGSILMSTPNIVSFRSLNQMISASQPYLSSQFLKKSCTDRHNREYTPDEINRLLEYAGYRIDYLITPSYYTNDSDYECLSKMLKQMGKPIDLRGDTIVARATKISQVKDRYPEFLYY